MHVAGCAAWACWWRLAPTTAERESCSEAARFVEHHATFLDALAPFQAVLSALKSQYFNMSKECLPKRDDNITRSLKTHIPAKFSPRILAHHIQQYSRKIGCPPELADAIVHIQRIWASGDPPCRLVQNGSELGTDKVGLCCLAELELKKLMITAFYSWGGIMNIRSECLFASEEVFHKGGYWASSFTIALVF